MARLQYIFVFLIFLFISPNCVFAVSPTISVLFPDVVTIGKENEIEVTVNNTTQSYNLKIYGSPTQNTRHSKYVDTYNGVEYVSSSWTNFPVIVGQVPTKIKFRVNMLESEYDYIYLKVGINSSTNIYSDWVKVSVTEDEQQVLDISTEDSDVVTTQPQLSLEFPDNIYYEKEIKSKVKIENSEDIFLIKILGSQDKKKYGIIKTINDNDYLNWNSSWDKFPTIKNDGEVSFIVDEVVDSLFIKLRAKNTNTLEYVESDWYDVEIKELIVEDEQEEKDLEDSETLDKSKTESNIKKNDKIRIDYSKIPYKPVAFNVYDKEPENTKNTVTDLTETKQLTYNQDKFDVKKVLNNLWQKMLAILPIQKN